ncbi:MAG: hypothetical protein ABIY50_09850 [Ignavibacteria bacterium]
MKKALKILVIIVSIICGITFVSPGKSEANTNTSLEITSAKADLFVIVRVRENGKRFLYIYTLDNIFITKIEEL